MQWHDLIGGVGVTLIISAYWLVQSERMTSRDPRWSVINLLGSSLVLVSLAVEWNLSAFLVEVFWVAISLYGLVRHARDRASREASRR